MKEVDVFIVGGGINGAGIARDAAGRGLTVVLCEKDDLAQGTSSRSGKLVHGGLRYLEYYEFRLVKEALIEREVLLKSASHIIWPMRFVLPHNPADRPAWLVRLGLFLYDHLGGRKKLPGTRVLDLQKDPEGVPLKDIYTKGFEFSDCWVDDSRLVTLNMIAAEQLGATILTRSKCVSARSIERQGWVIKIEDTFTGKKSEFRAKAIINAGGPWVNEIVTNVAGVNSSRNVRLVKGSHIVVPKFWKGQHAYLIQNADKRVIFVNPYQNNLALIGTTDVSIDGNPDDVAIEEYEVEYLIESINRYFKQRLRRGDVVQTFSGVRPLFDDGNGNPSAVTRDYVFDLINSNGWPLLNIFGGKITTYRKLAEHALEQLKPHFETAGSVWTANTPLPGGDFENADFQQFLAQVLEDFPWLTPSLGEHYARLYGTRLYDLIGEAKSLADLGRNFGSNLYEAEATFLANHEWAKTSDDILDRRTKHRLALSEKEQEDFKAWFNQAICVSERT